MEITDEKEAIGRIINLINELHPAKHQGLTCILQVLKDHRQI